MLRQLGWFELVPVRGAIEDGRVGRYQATLKVGYATASQFAAAAEHRVLYIP